MKQFPGSDTQDELTFLMRACGHILYNSGSSRTGQGRILHILDREGTVGQKQLQCMLGIQSGSVSEILSKLEHEELICRARDPQDRRKMVVSLTEKGQRHAQTYRAAQHDSEWFTALSEEEKTLLKDLLQRLLDSWNTESA